MDERRLPGVTNGKWRVRVKILDPDRIIPSYIIRKEEGELWSLLFEGRRFVCWKCGSSDHIGDKCREFDKTFEEVFGENDDNDSGNTPVSWAAVVKGKGGLSPDFTVKRDNYARQIREINDKKAKDKKDAEERKEAELAQQERLRIAEEERRHGIVNEAEQQARGAMEEAKERQDDAMNGLDDNEENLRIVTALAQPSPGGVSGSVHGPLDQQDNEVVGVDVAQSAGNEGEGESESPISLNSSFEKVFGPGATQSSLGVSGSDNGLFDEQGHEGVGVEVVKQAGNEGEEQSENPPSLDSSLETVFGPGATQLAKELGNNSDKKEEVISSDTEHNSDSEVEHLNGSTPAMDQRKKRVRKNIKFGDLGSIESKMDNHGASSEGEHSEETSKEVKKPRLGESSGTYEEDDNMKILENENIIAGDKAKNSEVFSDGKSEDKNHTEDGIMQVLLDMHEGVPLEDPGPNIEDGEQRVAGATQ